MTTICEKILELAQEIDGVSDRTIDSDWYDLDWDSIDEIEFILSLEDEFDVDIPDSVAEEWTSVRDVVKWIGNNIPEQLQLDLGEG